MYGGTYPHTYLLLTGTTSSYMEQSNQITPGFWQDNMPTFFPYSVDVDINWLEQPCKSVNSMVHTWVAQKTLKRDILRVFTMSDLFNI